MIDKDNNAKIAHDAAMNVHLCKQQRDLGNLIITKALNDGAAAIAKGEKTSNVIDRTYETVRIELEGIKSGTSYAGSSEALPFGSEGHNEGVPGSPSDKPGTKATEPVEDELHPLAFAKVIDDNDKESVVMGINEYLIVTLRHTLYGKDDIIPIILKELTQNAVDATRGEGSNYADSRERTRGRFCGMCGSLSMYCNSCCNTEESVRLSWTWFGSAYPDLAPFWNDLHTLGE